MSLETRPRASAATTPSPKNSNTHGGVKISQGLDASADGPRPATIVPIGQPVPSADDQKGGVMPV